MTSHRTWRSPPYAWPLAVCAAVCAAVLSGCASWQAPRIDPSGEHVLIWPGEGAPPVPYGAPAVAPPAAQPALQPMGNVEAPPVYSNTAPMTFAPGSTTLSNPFVPTVVGPPVTAVPAGPGQPVAPPVATPALTGPVVGPTTAAPIGVDHLRLAPERVLAPVGSEVVLKAGICTAEGYLLANQRVEWLLDRGGPGEIVDLNDRDEWDLFRWPSNTPRKVDNWYAIGATSTATLCLRRGTADPNDDVQILRGEAWITVTSPAEGTTRVTAYTPLVDDWQFRRAMATIYWVDAQWVFPPSAVVEPGRSHVLTTALTRRSDGAPIVGWVVRYAVAGGASLGYGGGSSVDVPTDAAGRASVEVTPTGTGGGSTTVSITLIRPPQTGPEANPQLEIGTGSATITWGAVAAPAPGMPAPSLPGPVTSVPLPGAAPSPAVPQQRAPVGAQTPPPGQPPAGKADLTVTIRREGPEEVTVGDHVRFSVVVTNRGDGTARRIEVLDKFDRGLSHPQALPNEFAVKYPGMRDLPPGESASVPLDFQVVAAGRQCHEVTVTAEGGVRGVERACITAREPPPAVQPSLSATMTGPIRQLVGEVAKFRTVITNTGDVPVTNIKVVDRYDPALQPARATAGHVPLSAGGLQWDIDRLDVGERREFDVECNCTMPSRSVCNRVVVTADGGVTTADEACLEILPELPAETPGAAAAAADLRLSITAAPNPTRVRQRTRINVTVMNTGQQPYRQVVLRLLLPPDMNPVADQIQAPVTSSVQGQNVQFAAIAEVGPGQQQQFVVPVDVNREGSVQVFARIEAEGLASGITVQSDVITIRPASL